MENEMNRYHDIEESFQKIRTSTGNSDVQEMVFKFATREQTYAQLLTAVSENEKKLQDLREANDNKNEELHTLMMNNDNNKGTVVMSDDNLEIIELEKDIAFHQKDLDILNNRKKNIHLIVDQINNWTAKVTNKLSASHDKQSNMNAVFEKIGEKVCSQLKEIIAENKKRSQA